MNIGHLEKNMMLSILLKKIRKKNQKKKFWNILIN